MGGKPMGKLLYIASYVWIIYFPRWKTGAAWAPNSIHGQRSYSHHLMVFSMFSTACAWDTFSCSARAIISSAFGSGLSCEDSALTWVASGEGTSGKREREISPTFVKWGHYMAEKNIERHRIYIYIILL